MGTLDTLASKGRGIPAAVRALTGARIDSTGNGAVVLAYHDVVEDVRGAVEYSVNAGVLRAQLEAMLGWGFRFTTLDALVAELIAGGSLDGIAAVTFDDGLHGVHARGLPVLRDLGLPATVFVVTGVRGIDPPFWPGAARTMGTEELLELVAGGMSLASHGCTHTWMTRLAPAVLDAELRDSRAALEALTGAPVDLLAYPGGHHDSTVRAAAAAAGYRAAFGFVFGRVGPGTDRLAVPRFCMSSRHHRSRLAYQLARPASAW